MSLRRAATVAAVLAGMLTAAGCGGDTGAPHIPVTAVPSPSAPTSPPTSAASASRSGHAVPSSVTVLAVGDIAQCGSRGDDATAAITARLVAADPKAVVLTLGDQAYPDGSPRAFANCYGPSWGRFTPRVRPVPGNHEYGTRNAAGYFAYFGKAAGERGKGYYSFDLGAWHLVALNSNCDAVGGCGPTSAQGRWLTSDLAAHPRDCTLAYWHHPRFSSGQHGSSRSVAGFWSALQAAGADVVLAGHDHDYERFAPQRADGRPDPNGIREFVVGTGGAEHRSFADRAGNSQRRISGVNAVLQLRLTSDGYAWALVGSEGSSRQLDSGTGTCSRR